MKTTNKSWAFGVAVALILSVNVASALMAQAPSTSGSASNAKQQATDLIRRARSLIAQNDLSGADKLISQAEALNANFGFSPFSDTPDKARRDLNKKRKSAGKAPLRPSELFQLGRKKAAPRTDPFAGRPAGVPSGSPTVYGPPMPSSPFTTPPSAAADRLPTILGDSFKTSRNSTPPAMNPNNRFGANLLVPPGAGAGNSMATDAGASGLLLDARRSLAVGDVRRANDLVAQARRQQATYGTLDDTPAKVEQAIAQYQHTINQPNRNSQSYRRSYVKVLMSQARALLRAGDLDTAERLADSASQQQIYYGPMEAKPTDLLREIAARRNTARPTSAPLNPGMMSPSTTSPSLAARNNVARLLQQARAAMSNGQLEQAESLTREADRLGVPDTAFAPGEDRPGLVLLDIRRARQTASSGVVAAAAHHVTPAVGTGLHGRTASRASYDPANDPTRNTLAQHLGSPTPAVPHLATPRPLAPPISGAAPVGGTNGMLLFQQGEAALRDHDADRAYQLFRQAAAYMNQLDPRTRQRLQERLQLMSPPNRHGQPTTPQISMAQDAATSQQILYRQIAEEVPRQEAAARAMISTDPAGAVALLEKMRDKVEASTLESAARARLTRRLDRALDETNRFIEQNRPRIELDERNRQVYAEVARDKRVKLEVQEKLALLVDDFNRKMDEERFAEAEVLAKRAAELDPNNPIIQQLTWISRFGRRISRNHALRAERQEGVIVQLDAVERSAIGFDDRIPYRFPSAEVWEELTPRRLRLLERQGRRTERELEIERKLRTNVSLSFRNEPLANVLDHLAQRAAVNLHLDPQGMAEEGVTSDTPVTIDIRQDIMLKSALNLILEPLHLSYLIKDEVLKVTSEQRREGEVETISYNVADLVIPIPNFVPTARMGLAGEYYNAMAAVGFGGAGSFGSTTAPLAVVASKNGQPGGSGVINPAVLAQLSGGGGGARNTPVGFGPGGPGGGVNADFDSLIELITETIQPTTWDEVGGAGSIAPFETNLSIVVSQTQEVHEEIVDLLKQLRRMQDLQVTIEVRFITLNDNFFERIGVDFDFDIDDDIDRPFQVFGRHTGVEGDPAEGIEPGRNTLDVDFDRSVTVGMSAPGVFSADLDIPFQQGSFGLAVPQFGGFDAAAGAQLGFAIMSDIEAFFFINAAQGDRRSNVLQAPKVTLFNGQQAYVSDTSQSPFVISVIPVVGDFAAAQQPVIVVLSEGSFMTVQAVVSHDKRFVRLTVVPFFSKIGDVKTFQFTGSQTTTTDTSADGGEFVDPNNMDNDRRDNATSGNSSTTTSSGTVVQLPTFSFVTVTTTVSVPDGGTVLLGGIKRLSEGRNEFGVPILNKIPYLKRLFKNVGIGRETQSLLMMVTPRIIIQEEEEERIGVTTPSS